MMTDETQFRQTGHVVVVTLAGPDVSGLQMAELVNEMTQRIRCDNTQFFVLDMNEIRFLDSSAIGALVGFLLDLEHVRGGLALARCQSNVEFLFKATRLDTIVRLFDEVDEAVEELV